MVSSTHSDTLRAVPAASSESGATLAGQHGHIAKVSQRPAEPRVTCVIPCFNEAENLQLLLPELSEFLAQRWVDWEIVLVDDGSSDNTSAVLEHWTRQPRILAIQFSRNFGKEAALTAGLEAAGGDVVVLLDGDLQHPPQLIDEMVERWKAGADMVYAARRGREDEIALKRWGAKLFYGMMNTGHRVRVPPNAGDFRLMDRAVVNAMLSLPERNRFMKGLYAWVGFRAEPVYYDPAPRGSGKTKFNALGLIGLSIDGLTGFTTWPLRLVSVTGLAFATVAFLYGAYLVASYFIEGNSVSGWTTIVVCLLLFSGIQMLSIGILGEYVSRIFEEVKSRPVYVVRRRLGERFEGDIS